MKTQLKYLVIIFFISTILIPIIKCQDTDENKFQQLEIITPQEITEGENFNVTILANGTTVGYVTIIYNNSENEIITETNNQGNIILTAPTSLLNNENIPITISATKTGYYSDEIIINITNLPNLIIHKQRSWVESGKQYIISVTDNLGSPIKDAQVAFYDGSIYYTDDNGNVTITAPDTRNSEERWEISVSKVGYASGKDYIYIRYSSADYSLIFFILCPFILLIVAIIIVLFIILHDKNQSKNDNNLDKKGGVN